MTEQTAQYLAKHQHIDQTAAITFQNTSHKQINTDGVIETGRQRSEL